MNMDEVGDAIPETGGTDAVEKADPNAGERCPGLLDVTVLLLNLESSDFAQ